MVLVDRLMLSYLSSLDKILFINFRRRYSFEEICGFPIRHTSTRRIIVNLPLPALNPLLIPHGRVLLDIFREFNG